MAEQLHTDPAKETAMENRMTEAISERVEAGRMAAADTLENTAERAHYAIDRRGEAWSDAAHRGADSMANAAQYLRTHDLNTMCSDASAFLRRHPTGSIIAAVVLGMFAGRAIRRA